MRKVVVFLMILIVTTSLSAQSRIAEVLVYISPATGGTAEEREYFDFNLREEIKGGGYLLANDLYSNPQEALENSDFFIDVALSYDQEYDEHIVTLVLYDTWTGKELVTSGMVYNTLEEMYDWNLTMIYRVMANAPIAKFVADENLEQRLSGGGGQGSLIKDPEYWLHLGLRAGPSIGLYSPIRSTNTSGVGFDLGLQAMVQVWRFLGIQAEAIFTMNYAPGLGIWNNDLTATEWNYTSYSMLFPLVVKGTFRPGRFVFAPFAGMYFWLPLTMTSSGPDQADETGTFSSLLPLGFTGGLDIGIRLGPGTLFLDTRYSADFGDIELKDGTSLYRRSMVSFTLGYEFKFFKKGKKDAAEPAVEEPAAE